MHCTPRTGLAILVFASASFAQQVSTDLEPAAPVRFAGTYHYATQTFTPGGQTGFAGITDVLFNESAQSGFFNGGMSGGNTYVDEGRVPSLSSVAPVGSQNSYSISAFEISYCTRAQDVGMGGPGAHIVISFYDKFGAGCSTLTDSAPATVAYELVGLPGGPNPGDLSCHTVLIDLTGAEFCLSADGDGANDGADLFGYGMQMLDEVNGSAGMIISGDPDVIPDDTVFTTGGAGLGSGLDAQDLFHRAPDGLETEACLFFGGYPANIFASHHMRIFGDSTGGECASCPNDDRFDSGPIVGYGDTCVDAVALAGPASVEGLTALDGDEDFYSITVPDSTQLDAFALFSTAQGDIDMRLYADDCTTLLDSSGSVSDNEDVSWINNSGGDVTVNIHVFLWPAGGATGCSDYQLDMVLTPVTSCGADDAFEDNDTCATAASVTAGLTSGLEAVDADEDYYVFTVAPGDIMTATALFSDAVADLDMRLFAADCVTLLDSSGSVSDDEQVMWTNDTGVAADVVINVFVWPAGAGSGCGPYELDIATVADPCLTAIDDGFEDNDDCATAAPLGAGSNPALFISDSDEDWYTLTVPAFEAVYASTLFVDADGDIDMRLFDSCGGTLLSSSESASDNEEVSYANATAAPVTVQLQVFFFGSGCNNYDLVVSTQPGQPGSPYCTAEANSTGFPALMSATGSSSASAQDIVFVCNPIPVNIFGGQFGVFFHGAAQDFAPFAGTTKIRCVANPVVRSPVQQANMMGIMTWDPDFNSLPGADFVVGATRYVQAWYRDPLDADSFNLSNGYCITFTQ